MCWQLPASSPSSSWQSTHSTCSVLDIQLLMSLCYITTLSDNAGSLQYANKQVQLAKLLAYLPSKITWHWHLVYLQAQSGYTLST